MMAAVAGFRRGLAVLRTPSKLRGTMGFAQTHDTCYLSSSAATPPAASPPAAPAPEQDIVKKVFFSTIRKVRTIAEELAKVRFTLDPDDPKAVAHYSSTMKAIRKKGGIPSTVERIDLFLAAAAKNSPDVRTYLMSLNDLRTELGIQDNLGADKLMLEAVTKVEKKIGKTLTRQDTKGISMLKAEFDAINSKLGISPKKVEELESKLDLDIAKRQMEDMKKSAIETMETYKRRDGLEEIQVDVKTLDHRNWL